jgi:hypothetical protein
MAQVGLGFAGFGGLIVTLLRENRSWSERDLAGLKSIMEQSLGVVLFGLVPFVFWYGLRNEQMAWRISNALLSMFFGWQFVIKILRRRQLVKRNHPPRYPRLFISVYLVPMALMCSLEMRAALMGSLFWYSVGLVLLLFQAFVQFWVFLTRNVAPDV